MNSVVVLVLAEVYARLSVPADQMPYTDFFEVIYSEVTLRSGESMSRAEFWKVLSNARKRGQLPRVGR
jgi:hypothetical protein